MRQLWFKDIYEQFKNKVTPLAHYNNSVVNPAKKSLENSKNKQQFFIWIWQIMVQTLTKNKNPSPNPAIFPYMVAFPNWPNFPMNKIT